MSEGEEIKKGTPPSRISEVPLTPEEKSAEVDKALEVMKRSLERRLALKRPESKRDIPPVLDTPDVDASQAQPIRKASVGGNMESKSNQITPKVENADARKDLSDFVDGLSEGAEFVVINKDGEPTSYWKRAGRRKGEVRLENAQGDHSRGDIIKILTKGGKLEKKAVVRAGAPVVDDATSTIFDAEKEKRTERILHWLGEYSHRPEPEIKTLVAELQRMLSTNPDDATIDDITRRMTEFDFRSPDKTLDKSFGFTAQEVGIVYEYRGNSGPVNRLVRSDEGYYFVDHDGARIGDPTSYSAEEGIRKLASDEAWQLVSVDGKDVATPDTGIDEKQAQKIRKDQVRAVVDQLGDLGTVEAADLATEGLKLQFLFDLTDTQVAEFEEKARALLSAPATVDQPLGTVDPVIRNLDGKGKEQKELFELHEGDEFNRTVDGKTEWIRVFKLQGQFVSVQKRALLANGDRSESAYGMTVAELQATLRDDKYERRLDLSLDNPASSDSSFEDDLAILFLGKGEALKYKGTRGEVTIERDDASGLYWITDEGFDKAEKPIFTRLQVIEQANSEQWKRIETTADSIDDTFIFQPLEKGGQAEYKGTKGDILLQRGAGDLYQLSDDQGVSGFVYDEEHIRNIAKEEQWQKIGSSLSEPNPELRGRDPRNYEELFEDDVWVVRDVNGDISKQLIIEHLYKNKGKVYASVEDVRGNDMTEREVEIEGLRRELEEQGYVLQKSGEKSERALDGSAPKPAIEAKDGDKMTEVERLKLLLEGDRLEFVTVDYKQNTAWSKVTGKIRALLGGERNDADTRIARERYENALIALQNAQIEDIKAQGLTGDTLRIRMGEMLMYYKYDERVKLFETRTRVAAEQKGWPQKAWDVYEKIGTKYNALPSKVRIGIAVGGLALAGGLAFAGAAGAAAGTLALRRALASFAAGASLNTLADKGAEGVRKYRVGKEHDREMTRLGALENQPPEVTLELLEKFLAKDRENLDKKFQSQKTEQILRRTFILGGSGLASTYFSFKGISDFLSGGARSAADQAQDLERVMRERGIKPPGTSASATETGRLTRSMAPATSASNIERASFASTPASASSAPTAALTPERPVSAAGTTPPAVGVTPSIGAETITSRSGILLEKYEVVSADGKRGLWGVMDRRIGSLDISPSDKNRVIASLQNILRTMTPEQLKEAGFRNGNIDEIYPGDKIEIGKLVTPAQLQAVIDGKSVVAPSVSGAVEKVARVASEVGETVQTPDFLEQLEQEKGVGFERAIDKISDSRFTEGINPGITDPYEDAKGLKAKSLVGVPDPYEDVPARPTPSYDEVKKAYGVKELAEAQLAEQKAATLSPFERASPEVKTEMMLRMTGYIQKSIFLTPELMADTPMNAPFDYTINKGAMAYVQMGRITEKFAELHSGEFNRFNRMAFPLHPSQVDQVVRLVSLAQDPRFFGTAGLPKPVENVEQYTRRIAQLALSAGKERELFLLLQSRRNSFI